MRERREEKERKERDVEGCGGNGSTTLVGGDCHILGRRVVRAMDEKKLVLGWDGRKEGGC